MDRSDACLSVIRVRRVFGSAIGAAACALAVVSCGEQVPSQAVMTQNDLCQNDFETCVMPVLSGQIPRRGGAVISCMDSNCHVNGGSGGRFTLGADNNANFQAVKNLINMTSPQDSLLLVEPTQDNVAPSAVAGTHGGGEIFPSRSDACYTTISNWISNQVLTQTSSSCGLCTPVSNTMTSCGY